MKKAEINKRIEELEERIAHYEISPAIKTDPLLRTRMQHELEDEKTHYIDQLTKQDFYQHL